MDTKRIARGAVATVGAAGLATAGLGFATSAPAGATVGPVLQLFCGTAQVVHSEAAIPTSVTGTTQNCPAGFQVQVKAQYKVQGHYAPPTDWSGWGSGASRVTAPGTFVAVGCVQWRSGPGAVPTEWVYSGFSNVWAQGPCTFQPAN